MHSIGITVAIDAFRSYNCSKHFEYSTASDIMEVQQAVDMELKFYTNVHIMSFLLSRMALLHSMLPVRRDMGS